MTAIPASDDANGIPVMLVEDNVGDIRLIQEALKSIDPRAQLTVARDGQEAIDILFGRKNWRPRLIILDLNLPRRSGQDVLREIKSREEYRVIPVVILSSTQAQDDIARAYRQNANCFISKPVDLDRFEAVVRSLDQFWFSVVTLPAVN